MNRNIFTVFIDDGQVKIDHDLFKAQLWDLGTGEFKSTVRRKSKDIEFTEDFYSYMEHIARGIADASAKMDGWLREVSKNVTEMRRQDFEEMYAKYDKKLHKSKAKTEYMKLPAGEAIQAKLALDGFLDDHPNRQYRPSIYKYLKYKQWRDNPEYLENTTDEKPSNDVDDGLIREG